MGLAPFQEKAMTTIKQADLIESVAAALQYISLNMPHR